MEVINFISIIRKALDHNESRIRIGKRHVCNLKYANETTLIGGTKEELFRNFDESKESRWIDGNEVEIIESFPFLETMVMNDGTYPTEVKRHLEMGRAAMVDAEKI